MASAGFRRFSENAVNPSERTDVETQRFLAALTDLSRQFGIGIAGDAVLFTMETGPESDYERVFTIDSDGKLSFV